MMYKQQDETDHSSTFYRYMRTYEYLMGDFTPIVIFRGSGACCSLPNLSSDFATRVLCSVQVEVDLAKKDGLVERSHVIDGSSLTVHSGDVTVGGDVLDNESIVVSGILLREKSYNAFPVSLDSSSTAFQDDASNTDSVVDTEFPLKVLHGELEVELEVCRCR